MKSFNTTDAGKIQAEVELNATHDIFKGHFPGSPVVPGVCLVQISKEILERSLDTPAQLIQSSQIKFLAVVDPTVNAALQVNLEIKEQEGSIAATSTISSAEKIFFKFKGVFKVVQ